MVEILSSIVVERWGGAEDVCVGLFVQGEWFEGLLL